MTDVVAREAGCTKHTIQLLDTGSKPLIELKSLDREETLTWIRMWLRGAISVRGENVLRVFREEK